MNLKPVIAENGVIVTKKQEERLYEYHDFSSIQWT
jgi:hypothetical protein